MATTAQWVEGARLRTLPLAVAPVLIGTGAAIGQDIGWGALELFEALLALIVSLALQVGVNYANDYSDGIRGTDDNRVGPFRLTGSRAAAPGQVKTAAFACFGLAGVAGLLLVVLAGQYWMLAIGVICVLAAWYYTGGKHPYGYSGLGEVAVFVFFGLVAVLGTMYTQVATLSASGVAAAAGMGSLACAVLVANNLRDIPTDSVTGKNTLAVRLGDASTRVFYVFLVATPFVLTVVIAPWHPWTTIALLALPLARGPVTCVTTGETGRGLIPALKDTGRLGLVWALLIAVGLGF
ncbi:1,4-dihydroxy-2-naphthoate polyprenyltransferase [Kineosporia sp. NBRC 101731]|uniref:1,4-dihydroxy-2-naphthoate polyprenyltransferase n=1 Tax=Kineosporia sp. NBRC 101731 TaxID=3032199 RepID=UPI0024A5B21B|nr:1,4-dihydroxy-2-naphthoate polyprenyltransferase [Kineosporia sp. NBRC 101731]GLY27600.1 1,4-dihydroxy-2-naphthoate octaprenyltransferase [Kineosporia sp. NBRC 101731]